MNFISKPHGTKLKPVEVYVQNGGKCIYNCRERLIRI